MGEHKQSFIGKWLHTGDWHGKYFTHELAEYDHDEHPGGSGATKMRHTTVEHDGQTFGVWAPSHWTDDEIREALTLTLPPAPNPV